MTALAPDVDVDDITHLDFSPPCEAKDCDDDATWLVTWSIPSTCGCTPATVICNTHLDGIRAALKADAILVCPHGRVGPLRDVLSRIEPL